MQEDEYRRVALPRGKSKPWVAVGHPTVQIVYYLLQCQESYLHLEANHLMRQKRQRLEYRWVSRWQRF